MERTFLAPPGYQDSRTKCNQFKLETESAPGDFFVALENIVPCCLKLAPVAEMVTFSLHPHRPRSERKSVSLQNQGLSDNPRTLFCGEHPQPICQQRFFVSDANVCMGTAYCSIFRQKNRVRNFSRHRQQNLEGKYSQDRKEEGDH